jgi:predicted DNA-binding transcriptional regulator YafY
MSKRESLLRYTCIINKVRSQPSTLNEIQDYLMKQGEIQGFRYDISARTFKRDLEEIFSLYKIDICYDFSTRTYKVNEDDDTETNIRMLEAFDTLNMLKVSEGISNYVFFERRKPKGTEFLYVLLHAIKHKLQINMKYQKIWSDEVTDRIIEPYALKESQNIWYVLAYQPNDDKVKTFGLDRIVDIDVLKRRFQVKKDFNIHEAFKYCFGIDSHGSEKPEEIILSFDPEEALYIKNLPLHETQEIIVDNEEECQIKLKLFLSYDFIMQIRSRGNRVKVLKPLKLKNMIIQQLKETLDLYE